ncbi:MAG: glutaredoxin family protein [Candidatus Micrarchaeia archaeon]|jgi:glutaredoxin-like YruB-family protein
MAEKNIIVYSTNACPYCVMLKSYLKQKGIKFKEINVGEDEKAAMEMIRATGQQGVPQIKIDGKWIVGFNKPKIDEALKD